jgi:hypothetical protein
MEEIKMSKCPFCGSDAELIHDKVQQGRMDIYYVECTNNYHIRTKTCYSPEEAMLIWDKRIAKWHSCNNRILSIAKSFIPKESIDLYYKVVCNGCIYNSENIESICCCHCQDGSYYETQEV